MKASQVPHTKADKSPITRARLDDDTPPAGVQSQAAALADQLGAAGARAVLSAVEVAIDLARLMALTSQPSDVADGGLAARISTLLPDAGWRAELAYIDARERRVDAYALAYQRLHYPDETAPDRGSHGE